MSRLYIMYTYTSVRTERIGMAHLYLVTCSSYEKLFSRFSGDQILFRVFIIDLWRELHKLCLVADAGYVLTLH